MRKRKSQAHENSASHTDRDVSRPRHHHSSAGLLPDGGAVILIRRRGDARKDKGIRKSM